MKNVTLRQFRYFEALAQAGHFGQAAEQCGISQPALSVQIKDLEASLGAVLFERSAKAVRMTSFGEEFAGRVREILARVDELGDLARTAGEGLGGRLRIGIIPTIAPYLLPRLLQDLVKAAPGVDIHVRETQTARLIEELGAGQIDAAILALPITEPWLQTAPLVQEPFVLVRSMADANAPVPSPETLREARLLLLEEGHCFRDQALSYCELGGASPREGLDGSTLSTLVQMVAANMGVTLIPKMAVDVETRAAAVAVAEFPDPAPSRRLGMVWRKTSPMSDDLLGLSDVVRGAMQTVVT